MRILVDAFAFEFEEDSVDSAIVLLCCYDMVRYQCTVTFLDVKVLIKGYE